MKKRTPKVKFISHPDKSDMIAGISSQIANENVFLKIIGYIYSVIFGIAFSIYPALTTIGYVDKISYFNTLGGFLLNLLFFQILTVPMLLIFSNLKKTIGIRIFYMGFVDDPSEIKLGPALMLIKRIDYFNATRQALMDMLPISLSIMAPGSLTFIGIGLLNSSFIYIVIGIIGLSGFIVNLTYMLFNKLKIEKSYRINQFEKVQMKLRDLMKDWNPPEPEDVYFD